MKKRETESPPPHSSSLSIIDPKCFFDNFRDLTNFIHSPTKIQSFRRPKHTRRRLKNQFDEERPEDKENRVVNTRSRSKFHLKSKNSASGTIPIERVKSIETYLRRKMSILGPNRRIGCGKSNKSRLKGCVSSTFDDQNPKKFRRNEYQKTFRISKNYSKPPKKNSHKRSLSLFSKNGDSKTNFTLENLRNKASHWVFTGRDKGRSKARRKLKRPPRGKIR